MASKNTFDPTLYLNPGDGWFYGRVPQCVPFLLFDPLFIINFPERTTLRLIFVPTNGNPRKMIQGFCQLKLN